RDTSASTFSTAFAVDIATRPPFDDVRPTGSRVGGSDPAGEQQETKADDVEGYHDRGGPPPGAIAPEPPISVPVAERLVSGHQRGVVQAIQQIERLRAVPESHQAERQEEADVGSRPVVLEPMPA